MRNGSLESKHIFAGNSRLCSKMVLTEEVEGEEQKVEKGIYYYHADHLGSSSSVTNKSGKFHEHLEYFPYGETWVHEKASDDIDEVHYKFTAKELDPETGLYYFGARYYDARLGRWVSVDPPMVRGEYFPRATDFDTEHDYYWYLQQDASKKLPGIGGVFNSVNLDVYHYAGNNPVRLVDPNGEAVIMLAVKGEGASGGGGVWSQGIAYDTTKNTFYFFDAKATSLGYRGDVGLDLNIVTSKTFEKYLNSNSIAITGDYKVGGLGLGIIENKGKLDFLINLSLGPGLGGSLTSSSLPNKTRYIKASTHLKLKAKFMKEKFNLGWAYIRGDKKGMINSFKNMLQIQREYIKAYKEK